MQQPRERMEIEVGTRDADTAAAIVFLGWLAFPDSGPKARRDRIRFCEECVALIWRRWAGKDSERWDKIPAAMKKSETRRIYKSGAITRAVKLIRRRLIIARYVAHLLQYGEVLRPARLSQAMIGGIHIKNLEAIKKSIVQSPGGSDTLQHVTSRWIGPTKPVLHLAVAIQHLWARSSDSSQHYRVNSEFGFVRFLSNPNWVGPALKRAEVWRLVFTKLPGLKIQESGTISLRPLFLQKLELSED
ncbi:MAG: hypothetical protein ACKVQK_29850 [Burkholderiales bacterium]